MLAHVAIVRGRKTPRVVAIQVATQLVDHTDPQNLRPGSRCVVTVILVIASVAGELVPIRFQVADFEIVGRLQKSRGTFGGTIEGDLNGGTISCVWQKGLFIRVPGKFSGTKRGQYTPNL